jgi:hypothetical protein
MSEVSEISHEELRAAVGNPVPEDLRRAWDIGKEIPESVMTEMLEEAPLAANVSIIKPEQGSEPIIASTKAGKMAEGLVDWYIDEFRKHPRASIGTFFLSLTAITADIEKGISDPRAIFAQIGMIGIFNFVGKKLKV